MSETNVKIVHSYLQEVWNERKVDSIPEFFSEDMTVHNLPATGKSFTISAIAIARLADGRIAEWWQIGDTLGLLQQIGAMPA